MASPEPPYIGPPLKPRPPFVPRVLRSMQGTVAVEVPPRQSDGVAGLFRIVQPGADFWGSPIAIAPRWESSGFTVELLTTYMGWVEMIEKPGPVTE